MQPKRQQLTRLRILLNDSLSEDELRTICADAQIDYENIQGRTKIDKIRELLLDLYRGKYDWGDFFTAVHLNRPDIDLSTYGGQSASKENGPNGSEDTGREKANDGDEDKESAGPDDEDKYENFDIFVFHQSGNQYLVRASYYYQQQSPINQDVIQTLDVAGGEIKELVTFLEHLAAEKEDAKTFGRLLYDFLFPRRIHSIFSILRSQLYTEERGVRIRLQIRTPALSRLPWEYCFDEENNVFLAQDRNTPLVRFEDQNYSPADLATDGRLRILHVVSSPEDKAPLNVDREVEIVKRALEPLASSIEREVLRDPSGLDLLNKLNSFKPQILHYTGHGQFKKGVGSLLLVNQQEGVKRSEPLDAERLATILRSSGVKIVVLNACETAAAAEETPAFMSVAHGLVLARVPAVVAMQYKMPDDLALRCAQALYTDIANGSPLDLAVTNMRIAASLSGTPQNQILWGVPVLFMTSPNGRIWKTSPRRPAGSTSPAAQAPSPAPSHPPSGGVHFGNIGGSVNVGGDIVGGDKTVTNSNDSPAAEIGPVLLRKLGELEHLLQVYLNQLDDDQRHDVDENLEDARSSLASRPPKSARAARKLGNVKEIFKESGIGLLILPLLESLIEDIKGV